MELRFTAHGRRRLQDLHLIGISEADVLSIIETPITRDRDPLTAETVDGLFHGRRIRVVYVQRTEYYLVITLYVIEEG